jgi:hypothetical protein
LSVICGTLVFFPGTPVSSSNKTDIHDITDISLKVTLSTINQSNHLLSVNYNSYASLNASETNELVVLCRLLNPRLLNDKCIFHSDEACEDFSIQFFEINAKRTTFAAVQSVMIGSVRAKVSKIMCYKMNWLKEYYTEPMNEMSS